MTATFTVGADERKALHGLLLRRLTILVERDRELALREGVSVEELYESFGDDLRLFDEVGLGFLIDRSSVDLAMPCESLIGMLKRLRKDARRAPCEARHEREPQETDEERWERFRRAVVVCEELLDRLDPPDRDQSGLFSDAGCPLKAADSDLGESQGSSSGEHTTSASDQSGTGKQGGPA
jgi:hypothetical protein